MGFVYLFLKTLMLGTIEQEEKGATEDEMVGWYHRLSGHEFEQAPGVGEGQGSLASCSPWGHKELDTTERLNRTENGHLHHHFPLFLNFPILSFLSLY